MTSNQQPKNVLLALDDLLETSLTLRANLATATADNGDAAHETVTLMLHQLIAHFGVDSVAAQQLFPAMDVIKRRIDSRNFVGAIWDTESLARALREIKEMVIAKQG